MVMVSNLLFSRSRLREKVRPPVYRSGGSSLAASCQPHAAPPLAHVAYACLAALRCARAGPAPAREDGTGRVLPLPEGARAPCTCLLFSLRWRENSETTFTTFTTVTLLNGKRAAMPGYSHCLKVQALWLCSSKALMTRCASCFPCIAAYRPRSSSSARSR